MCLLEDSASILVYRRISRVVVIVVVLVSGGHKRAIPRGVRGWSEDHREESRASVDKSIAPTPASNDRRVGHALGKQYFFMSFFSSRRQKGPSRFIIPDGSSYHCYTRRQYIAPNVCFVSTKSRRSNTVARSVSLTPHSLRPYVGYLFLGVSSTDTSADFGCLRASSSPPLASFPSDHLRRDAADSTWNKCR